MNWRERFRRRNADEGFTLIELVVTVAIVGFVVTALTGIVISYLKTTVSTQSRLTESHDVQFAAAYWQRDVASVGVRSTTYNDDPSVHSYPLLQSVAANPVSGIAVGCALPSGADIAKVVTLAWSQFSASDPSNPQTVTVTYLAKGTAQPYSLMRVRCTGGTVDSTVTVADNLVGKPVVACSGSASGCNGSGANVPSVVTMTLTANDPSNAGAASYSAKLTGERRQA